MEDDATGSDRKKFKFSSVMKCNYYGMAWHKYDECLTHWEKVHSKGKTCHVQTIDLAYNASHVMKFDIFQMHFLKTVQVEANKVTSNVKIKSAP